VIALFTWEYPWFVIVNSFFGLTLSFHFFALLRRDGLQCHASFFVIINLMLFLIWTFSGEVYAWFISAFFGSGIGLSLHYVAKTYHESPEKQLYIHATFWASVDAMCFAIWLSSGQGYPWFMHVIFTSAFFVIAHYCGHYFQGS
jgi:hypothetical protein